MRGGVTSATPWGEPSLAGVILLTAVPSTERGNVGRERLIRTWPKGGFLTSLTIQTQPAQTSLAHAEAAHFCRERNPRACSPGPLLTGTQGGMSSEELQSEQGGRLPLYS